ncbi:MAG TPA: methyltransferase [Bacteroidales bacterium]|nr:methyltransferase [Bacteroidales bacterium]HPI30866.1 methyltransferase [Bacteroidales bacterium]HQP16920.1 methyltransferase [Bacteroidales bacterium]
MKDSTRHIAGYFVGGSVFLLLIPYCFYLISVREYSVFRDELAISATVRIIISVPVILTGLVFAAWSNIFLFSVGKGGPVDVFNKAISPRTKKLVVSGPYRYSRNPMVFGAFCLYAGIAIGLNSARCLIISIIFLLIMVIYIKTFEEKRLLKDFGDEYLAYKKNVSMIFPVKFRKKKRG